MSQLAKTIYFPDYPKTTAGRSGLTVPFPDGFQSAFANVAHLSSYAIRELIGYDRFEYLERDARQLDTPTAIYARDLLVKQLGAQSGDENANFEAALQATFQGGRGSPLHDWYPYLEGYSPEFVNSIIDRFAPDARSILDPFCGSGTTALTAALRGRDGFYSEVNPVCRFVIEAKLSAMRLSVAKRERMAKVLEAISDDITSELRKASPDEGLRVAFGTAFGKSDFFKDDAFEQVLQLRTLADGMIERDRELGIFFTVAILRSLVPGSLLIRRGDLRFRNPTELRRNPPDLLGELRLSLQRVASDLHDAPIADGNAELVCSDARRLSRHMSDQVDAIITSPPYLNGTNYFRNTKIELWFLRELTSKVGLRLLRDAAITSGINDVPRRKVDGQKSAPGIESLEEVLSALRKNSYDSRIPMMVGAYFAEMSNVIENLRSVLKPNGVAAIDLGDSFYGTVWVPTDRILAEMMERAGFKPVERLVLRERQSRDGRKLSQTLQVFANSSAPKQASKASTSENEDPASWKIFKSTLPHQSGEMAKRNWGHPLHSLCSYQGKLKPAIANSLVKALVREGRGARILDPFSGVGTIPFEAKLNGHTAYGFDISPAALPITRAKIENVDGKRVAAILKELEKRIAKVKPDELDLTELRKIRFNGPLPDYFHQRTLSEIVAARSYFAANPPEDGASSIVFASMLHILHGNRPYALSRRSHPITPFAPTGKTEYRSVIERLRTKVEKSLLAIRGAVRGNSKAFFQDATQTWPSEVDELDAVITSPPFFDSTRFYSANWMRLWFAGWESEDFQTESKSFIDERQKETFNVYRPIFRQCAERLKRGGLVLVHLGKSVKCDMAKALEIASVEYLQPLDLFTESVEHCESHGIRDKGTVTHHQYLLLRRA
jgi:DNA modification methylase